MALVKTKSLDNGYSAEYWRIIRINALIDGNSEVFLALYKDKPTREVNPEGYVDVKTFRFSIPKAKLIEGNAFEYVYSKIAEAPTQEALEAGALPNWFADATVL